LYIKWSCLQYVVDLLPYDDEAYEAYGDENHDDYSDEKWNYYILFDETIYNPFHFANVMDKKTLRGLQTLFKIFWESWKVEITVIEPSLFFTSVIILFMGFWTLNYSEELEKTKGT
jgi:hypothetical protein